MTEPLLRAREVAELLDCSPETVLRWTRAGNLPGFRLPSGAIRYRGSDVEAWLAERAVAAPGREAPATRTDAALGPYPLVALSSESPATGGPSST